MKVEVNSTFSVTGWDENPYKEFENGAKLTKAKVSQAYKGDLIGEGEVEFLMSHTSNGTASFVGMELVNGILSGKKGTFIIQHINKHQNQTTASPTSNTQHVDTCTNIRTRLQPAQPAIHNTWTHEQTSQPDYSQPNQQYTRRGHMNKHQNQTTASPTSNTQRVDT